MSKNKIYKKKFQNHFFLKNDCEHNAANLESRKTCCYHKVFREIESAFAFSNFFVSIVYTSNTDKNVAKTK